MKIYYVNDKFRLQEVEFEFSEETDLPVCEFREKALIIGYTSFENSYNIMFEFLSEIEREICKDTNNILVNLELARNVPISYFRPAMSGLVEPEPEIIVGMPDTGLAADAETFSGFMNPITISLESPTIKLWVSNSEHPDWSYDNIFGYEAHSLPVNMLYPGEDLYTFELTEETESFEDIVTFVHTSTGFSFDITIRYFA